MTDAIPKEVTENDHIRRLVFTVLFVVGFSCFVLGLVVREIIEPSVACLLFIVIGIVGATFFEYIIYGDEDTHNQNEMDRKSDGDQRRE